METAISDIKMAMSIDSKYEKYQEFLSSLNDIAFNEESLMKEKLKTITNGLTVGNTISENVKIDVKASVKEEVNLEGNKEINLHVEYLYEVIKATIEQKTDDFPPGGYKLTSSNAAKLTAKLLKQTIENELAKYFTSSTKVSIKITGTTDGTPIQSAIPYGGDYGNFDEEMYFLNDNLETVSISSKTGIKTNAQLAFLRTQGIRKFLETYVEPLKQTDNAFQHFAIVKAEKGSQYRKISVEIVIHDAFNLQKREKSTTQNNNIGSDLSKLFLKCKKPVFMVFTSDKINTSQGSGFFINSSGVAVSNYHVFEGTYFTKARIYTEDGKTYEVEKVLEKNKEDDYIIFKVKNPYNVKFPFVNTSFLEPIEGEKVFAITNPVGLEKTLSDGIISAFRENKDLIQTTTPITHGSSGGPLFNMRGEVIGITTKGLQEGSLFFAINIKRLNLIPYK
jgi:serine protease Do